MVMFLISASFLGATLNRGRRLLESGAYSDWSVDSAALTRGRRLFETRLLLEEIR